MRANRSIHLPAGLRIGVAAVMAAGALATAAVPAQAATEGRRCTVTIENQADYPIWLAETPHSDSAVWQGPQPGVIEHDETARYETRGKSGFSWSDPLDPHYYWHGCTLGGTLIEQGPGRVEFKLDAPKSGDPRHSCTGTGGFRCEITRYDKTHREAHEGPHKWKVWDYQMTLRVTQG